MDPIILFRKDFVADANGVLTRSGHIKPLDDAQKQELVQSGSQGISGNNDAVATVALDPVDPYKFLLTWVGAGTVSVQATADADLDPNVTTTISGSQDYILKEDEATTLQLVLDPLPGA